MTHLPRWPRICATCLLLLLLWPQPSVANMIRFFTDPGGNTVVSAIAGFQGKLYVATVSTFSAHTNNRLYRVDVCSAPVEVILPTSGSEGRMALASFKNVLVLASGKKMLRTTDGIQWSPGNWTGGNVMTSMVEFKGDLYVVAEGGVLRTNNGVDWTPVGSVPKTKGNVEALAAFGEFLYAGVGLDNQNGIQIFESYDGETWRNDFEVVAGGGLVSGLPGHVHAMQAFKGSLYVGEYHGTGFYVKEGPFAKACTAGTCALQGTWTYRTTGAAGGGGRGVLRLAEFKDRLFVGLFDYLAATGQLPSVIYSENGSDWAPLYDTAWGSSVLGVYRLTTSAGWAGPGGQESSLLLVGTGRVTGGAELYMTAGPLSWMGYGCPP